MNIHVDNPKSHNEDLIFKYQKKIITEYTSTQQRHTSHEYLGYFSSSISVPIIFYEQQHLSIMASNIIELIEINFVKRPMRIILIVNRY